MKLQVEELTRLIRQCFAHARDNANFTLGQRRVFRFRGKLLRNHLISLISAYWRESKDPEIAAANAKLAALNRRMKSTEKTLAKYTETVEDLTELAAVLENLLGLATKFI